MANITSNGSSVYASITEVSAYWNARPCNVRHSPKPVGTKEYFDEVEARKYFVEAHIPGFADFDRWKGKKVLEIGCGIGTDTINFARHGAQVTAVDINKEAVRCVRANILLHHLEDRLDVREGDLFAPVVGEQFDLILFNPPFYERPARDMADRAWAGGSGNETLRRFLCAAPAHLRPGGELLIAGSTEAPYTANLPYTPGYTVRLIGRRELIGEALYLFALRPRPPLSRPTAPAT